MATNTTFYLTTYQNYVTLTSGLALTLDTKVTSSAVVMKKIAAGSTEAVLANFRKEGNIYYQTDYNTDWYLSPQQ